MSDRTIDALKLIVEELDEHTQRLTKVEDGQRKFQLVADSQSKQIENLERELRDMKIRERKILKHPTQEIAADFGLSAGRVSQITAPLRLYRKH